ncbi:hypothetical protein KIPB_000515 [Kipferlia bialata]|uniref:Big-1 domain-containing protein n=1 Tax=Kipferlia bialata TaxID=797122 RepID=A0A9K3CMG5_9EUKA|nr:hypothetical protein KIPB_000515 [Kipferlia bialata]|eukprot:g515.t1
MRAALLLCLLILVFGTLYTSASPSDVLDGRSSASESRFSRHNPFSARRGGQSDALPDSDPLLQLDDTPVPSTNVKTEDDEPLPFDGVLPLPVYFSPVEVGETLLYVDLMGRAEDWFRVTYDCYGGTNNCSTSKEMSVTVQQPYTPILAIYPQGSDTATTTPEPVSITLDPETGLYTVPLPTGLERGILDIEVTVKDCTVTHPETDSYPISMVTEVMDVTETLQTYVYTDTVPFNHDSLIHDFWDGSSVSVDGLYAAFGVPYRWEERCYHCSYVLDETFAGSVHLYGRPTAMAPWALLQTITPSETLSGTELLQFGTSIALRVDESGGVTLAVTAPGAQGEGVEEGQSGRVLVYTGTPGASVLDLSLSLSDSVPCPLSTPVPSSSSNSDTVLHMSMTESLIAIADVAYVNADESLGAVHMLHRDEASLEWAVSRSPKPVDHPTGLSFGAHCSLDPSGTRLAVSTSLAEGRDVELQTAAYLFTPVLSGGDVVWMQHSEISVTDMSWIEYRTEDWDYEPFQVSTDAYRFSVSVFDGTLALLSAGLDLDQYSSTKSYLDLLSIDDEGGLTHVWTLSRYSALRSVTLAETSDGTLYAAYSGWSNQVSLAKVAESGSYVDIEGTSYEVFTGGDVFAFDGETVVGAGGNNQSEITTVETGPDYLRVVEVTEYVHNRSTSTIVAHFHDDSRDADDQDGGRVKIQLCDGDGVCSRVGYLRSFDAEVSIVVDVTDLDSSIYVEAYPESACDAVYSNRYVPSMRVSVQIREARQIPSELRVDPVAAGADTVVLSLVDAGGWTVGSSLSVSLTSWDGEDYASLATYDPATGAFSAAIPSDTPAGPCPLSVTVTQDGEEAITLEASTTVYTNLALSSLTVTDLLPGYDNLPYLTAASGNWAATVIMSEDNGERHLLMYRRPTFHMPYTYEQRIPIDGMVEDEVFPSVALDGEWMVLSVPEHDGSTVGDLDVTGVSLRFYKVNAATGRWEMVQTEAVPQSHMSFASFEWEPILYQGGVVHVSMASGTVVYSSGVGESNCAHVYNLTDEGVWEHQQTLEVSDIPSGLSLGLQSSLNESGTLVGLSTYVNNASDLEDIGTTIPGAYEFSYDAASGLWTQTGVVTSPFSETLYTDEWVVVHFVSIHDDTIVVTSATEIVTGEILGVVRVYDRTETEEGTSYTLSMTLPQSSTDGYFGMGANVVITDTMMVIDDLFHCNGAESYGLVSFYERQTADSQWTMFSTLTAADVVADEDVDAGVESYIGFGLCHSVDPVSGEDAIIIVSILFGWGEEDDDDFETAQIHVLSPSPSPLSVTSYTDPLLVGSNTVEVTLQDSDGLPVSDATVSLLGLDSTYTLVSEGDGSYTVDSVSVSDDRADISLVATSATAPEAATYLYGDTPVVKYDSLVPVSVSVYPSVLVPADATPDSVSVHSVCTASSLLYLAVLNQYGSVVEGASPVTVSIDSGAAASASYDDTLHLYTVPVTAGSLSVGTHQAVVSVSDPTYPAMTDTVSFQVHGVLSSLTATPSASSSVAGESNLVSVALSDADGTPLVPGNQYECSVTLYSDYGVATIHGGLGTAVTAHWDAREDAYVASVTSVSTATTEILVTASCSAGVEADSVSESVPYTVTAAAMVLDSCTLTLVSGERQVEEYCYWTSIDNEECHRTVYAGEGLVVSAFLSDEYLNPITDRDVPQLYLDSTDESYPLTLDTETQVYTYTFGGADHTSIETLTFGVTVGEGVVLGVEAYDVDVVANPNPDPDLSVFTYDTTATVGTYMRVTALFKDQYGNTIHYSYVRCGFLSEDTSRRYMGWEYIGDETMPGTSTFYGSVRVLNTAGELPIYFVGSYRYYGYYYDYYYGSHWYYDGYNSNSYTMQPGTVTATPGPASRLTVDEPAYLKAGGEVSLLMHVTDWYGNTVSGETLSVSTESSSSTGSECVSAGGAYTCDVTYTVEPQRVAPVYAWYDSSWLPPYTLRVVGDDADGAASTVSPDNAVMGADVTVEVSLASANGITVLWEPKHPLVYVGWSSDLADATQAAYTPSVKGWLTTVTAPDSAGTDMTGTLHVFVNDGEDGSSAELLKTHSVSLEDQTPRESTTAVFPALAAVDTSQRYTVQLRNILDTLIVEPSLSVSVGWESEDPETAVFDLGTGSYSLSLMAPPDAGEMPLEVYVDDELLLSHYVTLYAPQAAASGSAVEVSDVDEDSGYGEVVAMAGDWTVIAAPRYGDNDSGKVFFMESTDEGFTERDAVTPQTDTDYGLFGSSLCMAGDDGAYVAYIGYPGAGQVEVYSNDGSGWVYTAVLGEDDWVDGNGYGDNLACTIDRVMVGAPSAFTYNVPNSGAAYVYACGAGTCTLQAQLVSNPVEGSLLGTGVALSGDTASLTSGGDVSQTTVYEYDSDLERWELVSALPYGGGDLALCDGTLVIETPAFPDGFAVFTAASGYGSLEREDSSGTETKTLPLSAKDTAADALSLSLSGSTLVVSKANASTNIGSVTVYKESSGVFVGSPPIPTTGSEPAPVAIDESGNLLVGSSGDDSAGVTAFDLASPAALVLDTNQATYVQGTADVGVQFHFMDTLGESLPPLAGGVSFSVGSSAAVTALPHASLSVYDVTMSVPEAVGHTTLKAETAEDSLTTGIVVVAGPPSPIKSSLVAPSATAGADTEISVMLRSSYDDVNYDSHDVTITWTSDAGSVSGSPSIDETSGLYAVTLAAGTVSGTSTVTVSVGDEPTFLQTSVAIAPDTPSGDTSSLSHPEELQAEQTVRVVATVHDQYGNTCSGRDVSVAISEVSSVAAWDAATSTYAANIALPAKGDTTLSLIVDSVSLLSVPVTVEGGSDLLIYAIAGGAGLLLTVVVATCIGMRCRRRKHKDEVDMTPEEEVEEGTVDEAVEVEQEQEVGPVVTEGTEGTEGVDATDYEDTRSDMPETGEYRVEYPVVVVPVCVLPGGAAGNGLV